jgi:hypothetical protein
MDWDRESNPPLQNFNASSANARGSSVSSGRRGTRTETGVGLRLFHVNYGTEDRIRIVMIQYL